MKKILVLALAAVLLPVAACAKKTNNAEIFFNTLKKHCGNAYEGVAVAGGEAEPFAGQKLVMHMRECGKNRIKIPFYVGEDRSRTWVLTLKGKRILLKHDHRHEDGASDDVTMYGGWSTNTGFADMQVFPADQETVDTIDYAASNVWWMTADDKAFSYNLRRMGSDRLFSVRFDFDKKLKTPPPAPWGWTK